MDTLDNMFKDDDFFIQVVKYGANDFLTGGKGLTYDDLKSKMQAFGYRVETLEEHEKIWQVIREAFVYPEGMGGCRKYYLSLDYFFSFLDYVELNELENYQKYAS